MIKVKDRMSRTLKTMPDSATVFEAANFFKDEKISAVFVTSNDEISGIVTDADLVKKVMAENRNPQETSLKEVMSKNIITIDLEDSLTTAGDAMDRNGVRHLGVTGDDKIIGVISVRDLIHPVYSDGEGW